MLDRHKGEDDKGIQYLMDSKAKQTTKVTTLKSRAQSHSHHLTVMFCRDLAASQHASVSNSEEAKLGSNTLKPFQSF